MRLIHPSDAPRLQRMAARLSPRTVYTRFFNALPRLSDAMARHFAEVDYRDRLAPVALDPADPEAIIAVARFDRSPGADAAETAVLVEDRFQGRGLVLLLVVEARARGIQRLVSHVLADNPRAIRLAQPPMGYAYRTSWEEGVVRIEMETAPAREPGPTSP